MATKGAVELQTSAWRGVEMDGLNKLVLKPGVTLTPKTSVHGLGLLLDPRLLPDGQQQCAFTALASAPTESLPSEERPCYSSACYGLNRLQYPRRHEIALEDNLKITECYASFADWHG